MSWVRIWTQIVFTTKDRKPWLTDEIRPIVFQHMLDNCQEKNLKVAAINGYKNHAHVLLAINREISLAKSVQLIKGESAFWLNKQNTLPEKFMWQDDYWAVGVSESHFKKVLGYIENQEEHHKQVSFQEELDAFLNKYKE